MTEVIYFFTSNRTSMSLRVHNKTRSHANMDLVLLDNCEALIM